MNTYTLLLVDDEEEVIQIILKKIHWEELGFSVIGHADNGVKALEMIEEFQPDVVMTDIKMPYIDGMELCKHIRAEFPETKVLFFTGFDEFEYAKEAIHLEIEEYILKPLNASELTNVLARLKRKMDQEMAEKRSVEILQAHYLESLPFLKANFYSSLIEGRVREEEISKYLSDYQITFTGDFFCCLVVHTTIPKASDEMNPQLLRTSVYKQTKEHLAEKWPMKCFTYLDDTILIAQFVHENQVSELTDECDKFCRYLQRILGVSVTVGIGQVCETLMELPKSYRSAREAISYRVLYGSARAINIQEIAPQDASVSDTLDDEELSSLFQTIRLGTEEDIQKSVHTYFYHVFSNVTSLQQHQIAVMELMSALYRFAVNNDIQIEDFSEEIRALYSRLLDLEPNGLKEWLLHISLLFHDRIVNERSKSTKSVIRKAKEYVHNNYRDEELSLDKICEVLGVSNSYFSTIFKKETGNSFIGYLTDYRMEKAARKLVETDEKSYMIAKSVGYTDPNYFSYVFKRRFGVSPSKYRTEYAKQ